MQKILLILCLSTFMLSCGGQLDMLHYRMPQDSVISMLSYRQPSYDEAAKLVPKGLVLVWDDVKLFDLSGRYKIFFLNDSLEQFEWSYNIPIGDTTYKKVTDKIIKILGENYRIEKMEVKDKDNIKLSWPISKPSITQYTLKIVSDTSIEFSLNSLLHSWPRRRLQHGSLPDSIIKEGE